MAVVEGRARHVTCKLLICICNHRPFCILEHIILWYSENYEGLRDMWSTMRWRVHLGALVVLLAGLGNAYTCKKIQFLVLSSPSMGIQWCLDLRSLLQPVIVFCCHFESLHLRIRTEATDLRSAGSTICEIQTQTQTTFRPEVCTGKSNRKHNCKLDLTIIWITMTSVFLCPDWSEHEQLWI